MKKIVNADTLEPVDPQVGYVDGYSFGDRLLEGVMFEIKLNHVGDPICTGVAESHKSYMEKFSVKQMLDWSRSAVEIAEVEMVDATGQIDLMIEEV